MPDAALAGAAAVATPPPIATDPNVESAAPSTAKPATMQASALPIRPQIAAVARPVATDQPAAPIRNARDETASATRDDVPKSQTAIPNERTPAIPASRDGAPAFTLPPAPVAPPAQPSAPGATVTAQPGRIGHELGVAIAHHVAGGGATGGGETITLRLNPIDMGRIEVKLSFDDGGTLRAIVSADNPAALDMLRRDSADLGRALTDAGVRADNQTLRFDTRAGAGQGEGQSGNQPWQRQPERRTDATHDTRTDTPDDITAIYRPLRSRSRIDMVA